MTCKRFIFSAFQPTTSPCQNGEVKLNTGKIPLLCWNYEWVHICGDAFWNDHHGSNIICKQMGFQSGTVKRIHGQSSKTDPSIFVGVCKATDTSLLSCSGGFNTYRIKPFRQCTQHTDYYIECV